MQAVSDRAWLAGRDVHEANDLWNLTALSILPAICVESETPSLSGACASLHAKAAEEFYAE